MQLRQLSHIRYRRFFFFRVNDYFLTDQVRPTAAINYCIQCPVNVNQVLNEFYTLLADLQQPEAQLWNNIYHRCRSEINSFIVNQSYSHILETDPTNAQLNEVTCLFNHFATYKGIRKAEMFRLKAYLKHKILAISYIKQNGEFLCINFYRLTEARATNLYSFNLLHTSNPLYSASHYGRAHRALHWLDMLHFKKIGVMQYDFCGWYNGQEDKALMNINAFKEQFGGQKVKEYSGVIYTHWLLKLLKALK